MCQLLVPKWTKYTCKWLKLPSVTHYYLILSTCRQLLPLELTYECPIIYLFIFCHPMFTYPHSQYEVRGWKTEAPTFRGLLLIRTYVCKTSFSQYTGLKCTLLTTKCNLFMSVNLEVPITSWQLLKKYDTVSSLCHMQPLLHYPQTMRFNCVIGLTVKQHFILSWYILGTAVVVCGREVFV